MGWIKRFLVFAGDVNCPQGGWHDFKGSFDSVEDARAAVVPFSGDGFWYEIIDSENREFAEAKP